MSQAYTTKHKLPKIILKQKKAEAIIDNEKIIKVEVSQDTSAVGGNPIILLENYSLPVIESFNYLYVDSSSYSPDPYELRFKMEGMTDEMVGMTNISAIFKFSTSNYSAITSSNIADIFVKPLRKYYKNNPDVGGNISSNDILDITPQSFVSYYYNWEKMSSSYRLRVHLSKFPFPIDTTNFLFTAGDAAPNSTYFTIIPIYVDLKLYFINTKTYYSSV